MSVTCLSVGLKPRWYSSITGSKNSANTAKESVSLKMF
jgi:hypothetical protein